MIKKLKQEETALIRETIGLGRFYRSVCWRRIKWLIKRLIGRHIAEYAVEINGEPFASAGDRRRVLLVASDNNRGSGAFRCCVEVASQIRTSQRYDVLVVIPNDGDGAELLRVRGLAYALVPSRDWVVLKNWSTKEKVNVEDMVSRVLINRSAVSALVNLIRQYQIDVVHCNTTYTYVGALAAKAACIPCVWHLREFLEEDQERKIVAQKFGNRLIGESDRILTVSESVRHKYLSLLPSEKMCTVYDGVDVKRFLCESHEVFVKRPYTFVFVGNYYKLKGQGDFAQACVKLYEIGFRDFRVWFVGKWIREACGSIFEQAGMADLVTYWGFQSNPENYLRQADAAFVCSKSEAFGLVTVEALLSGCLVIGSDSACTGELVREGETGLSFHYQEGAGQNIFDAMKRMIANPERMQEIAADAREYAKDNFSAERNGERIMSVYDEVLKERS